MVQLAICCDVIAAGCIVTLLQVKIYIFLIWSLFFDLLGPEAQTMECVCKFIKSI